MSPEWEELLDEIDEYLYAREDVKDSEHFGEVLPNDAMRLRTALIQLRAQLASGAKGGE